jgi:hypothetical protein
MSKNSFAWLAACALLPAVGSGGAVAQTAAAAGVAPGSGGPVIVDNGTREYVWTISIPVLTTERVAAVVQVPVLTLHGRRWDYELPDLKTKRFKLGQVAEFSCRYSDLGLPETCSVHWQDVYADLPVFAMQRDHLDYDAPEWTWQEQTLHIDVPRWSWHESTFTLSLPPRDPEDVQNVRQALDAQQAAATRPLDQGIATLDTSIAAVEAQGADPRRLANGDVAVDLPALREALRAAKAQQLEHLAAIRGELRDLGAGAIASP